LTYPPSLTLTEAFLSGRSVVGGVIQTTEISSQLSSQSKTTEEVVDLCVIGGGVSGLVAAITAAETTCSKTRQSSSSSPPLSILLLETSNDLGGRIRTDITSDGYILDRGFAVFVEDYPTSRRLLDYDALDLRQFSPGAMVKLFGHDGFFTKVSDPRRRPNEALLTVFSPICGPLDKLRLLPLFFTVLTKSVDELFAMTETDAYSCLRSKYGFSDEFVNTFFAPFLEGIYLAPLHDQSSRMLHFILKMFAGGNASLPWGGMRAVVDQLSDRAVGLGINIQNESRVVTIKELPLVSGSVGEAGKYTVEIESRSKGRQIVNTRTIVIATDVDAAQSLLVDQDEPLIRIVETSPSEVLPPRRSVGCIYYAFQSPAPVLDPILILNGEGGRDITRRNNKDYPINNICFPSRVVEGYAPNGYEICSVVILENALDEHGNDNDSLDKAVRNQLATWFPDFASDIIDETKWIRKEMYVIKNAQPANYHRGRDNKVGCANVHGGRDCFTFRGAPLPVGIFVCGDHMATATLNGALESGVNAGHAAVRVLSSTAIKLITKV
jgi:phytoene dehydrogenase-like protein